MSSLSLRNRMFLVEFLWFVRSSLVRFCVYVNSSSERVRFKEITWFWWSKAIGPSPGGSPSGDPVDLKRMKKKKKFKFSFGWYLSHLNGVFIAWPTWRLSIDASFDIFQPIKNGDRVVSPERLWSGFRPIRTGIVAKCLDLAHRTWLAVTCFAAADAHPNYGNDQIGVGHVRGVVLLFLSRRPFYWIVVRRRMENFP